jgi:drug/metabolite transporter (DMT)-like permease
MNSQFLSIIFALSAALSWGSGDFASGLSSRRIGSFHTILIGFSVGMMVLIAAAVIIGEPFPSSADLAWGVVSGLLGMSGIYFLLRGFIVGKMGIVAPFSAVLATVIPVLFTALTKGLPGTVQTIGFIFAIASIWMLSRPDRIAGRPEGIGYALLAGIGIGLFFIALDQIQHQSVVWPLAAGRIACIAALIAVALIQGKPLIPKSPPVILVTLAGIFDAGGNLFFLLAIQHGRLDVASVLGNLYPAVTALLAVVIAKERMTTVQIAGIGIAVTAIALITK